MDVVITYVDGNDPVWKADYQKYTNIELFLNFCRQMDTQCLPCRVTYFAGTAVGRSE